MNFKHNEYLVHKVASYPRLNALGSLLAQTAQCSLVLGRVLQCFFRSLFDCPVVGCVIVVHEFLQNVYLSLCLIGCKVLVHPILECPVEYFHHMCLSLVFCSKSFHTMCFEESLCPFVYNFGTLVRFQELWRFLYRSVPLNLSTICALV